MSCGDGSAGSKGGSSREVTRGLEQAFLELEGVASDAKSGEVQENGMSFVKMRVKGGGSSGKQQFCRLVARGLSTGERSAKQMHP